MRDGKMHQTTVRFGPDLWAALEEECAQLGMSAAQYVREATLARLSYTAGRTGAEGDAYDRALSAAGAAAIDDESGPDEREQQAATDLELAQLATDSVALDAAAVAAQGRLARARSREIRAQSADLRTHRVGVTARR